MAQSQDKRKVLFLLPSSTRRVRNLPPAQACVFQAEHIAGTQIATLMGELIDKYFRTHLDLSADEAYRLHIKYYKEYGLAIQGLVAHHEVDALDFNAKVDDALPLEDILKPNPQLRKLLTDIDTSRVKLWLLTNAYVNHGRRVVRLLGVDDLFEGITYCDYASQKFLAKPERGMFEKAMREAGAVNAGDCFFVDDSYINAQGAQDIGWHAVHLVETSEELPDTPASQYQIRSLEELRTLFPYFFR